MSILIVTRGPLRNTTKHLCEADEIARNANAVTRRDNWVTRLPFLQVMKATSIDKCKTVINGSGIGTILNVIMEVTKSTGISLSAISMRM